MPAKASAKLDFRLVPGQDPYDILAKLQVHLETHGFEDVTVTQLGAGCGPSNGLATIRWCDWLRRLAKTFMVGQPNSTQ